MHPYFQDGEFLSEQALDLKRGVVQAEPFELGLGPVPTRVTKNESWSIERIDFRLSNRVREKKYGANQVAESQSEGTVATVGNGLFVCACVLIMRGGEGGRRAHHFSSKDSMMVNSSR